jgi:HAD superfamily hydrolase (TIGR01509 family)
MIDGKNLKAIIFDLDGVLINSEPLHLAAWQDTLKQYELSFNPAWYKRWVGIQDRKLGDYLVSNYDLAITNEQILQQKTERYQKLLKKATFSSHELQKKLKKLYKWPLGLATSSPKIEVSLMLNKIGLDDIFKVIITGDDVIESKPAPECYLEVAKRLKVPSQNCLVIEDSPAGIQAGKSAGMMVIAITSNFSKHTLHAADYIFKSTVKAISWIVNC